MFIIFSGVSGAGKQTVIDSLMKKFKNTKFVKSATTRPERKKENTHYFFSDKQFEECLKHGDFFENENVHGYMYGILNKDLQEVIDNPDIIFFKDVDVHGTEKLVKFLQGKAKVVTIFLEVPDEVLFKRLIERGESVERANIRISRGKMERKYKGKYDYVIENIDLDKATRSVERIIKKHQK